jgi:hypothetical protein
MQTLYTDTYVEIQKPERQDFLEIIQKQQIDDTTVFYALSEKIITTLQECRCSSIVFIVNDIKYYPDTNYYQETFVPELGKQGVKNIAVVISNNEQVKVFHKELDNSLRMVKLRYGMVLRFFSKVSDARRWVKTPTIVFPHRNPFDVHKK